MTNEVFPQIINSLPADCYILSQFPFSNHFKLTTNKALDMLNANVKLDLICS